MKVEARAGNPAVAAETLEIKDLRSPDFGVLYQLSVSNPARLGKCIVSWGRPLAHCHGETRDIRNFTEVIDRRTIGRSRAKGDGLPSLAVRDLF